MSLADVGQVIDRIDGTDASAPRKRVTILGAGMAGLVAAYELSRLGHDITLIEGQNRVGGRVWTHRFNNGDYHELGAMRIPNIHFHTLHYISQFGLQVRPFVNHHGDKDTFYHFRGITTRHREYKIKLLPSFSLSKNDLQLLDGDDTPAIALMAVLGKAATAVKADPASRKALFAEGPMTDLVEDLDTITLRQYLARHLDTADAVELAGVATGLEVWWDKAASMLIREELAQEAMTGLHEIVGGADLLPSALLKALEGRANVKIRLMTEVLAVHNQARGVQLMLAPPTDGKNETVEREVERVDADYVICTIPFSALRRMSLSGLPSDKNRAIRNYHYADSTKVLFSCAERFWETGYDIFGGGSQTDLINRQIYYPSDSSGDSPLLAPEAKGMIHLAYTTEDRTKPQPTTKRSGPLVGSYVWDGDARRLGSLPSADRARVVANCVAEIHPEILENGMVLEHASIDWGQFRWSAGAFSFMRPGDLRFHYANVIRPEGRLYFAGEHCSLDQAWIEGAVRSALTAVQAIVARKD